ncbi:MAG: 16S rRNA (guanine(966)-N(2))-methyltransferase RsmD [Chloroflexi bacterium]|nr:16S rRNA (guanine(966)-N(2))-methyltransferase RsmD [Chloroflexota bacterium]
MRVIAGEAKGCPLKASKTAFLRPTSDLIRGAIFSLLESMDVSWERVLDLYAGTGALGIEALSRGAAWADFVEKDYHCCETIKVNLERTKLADRAHVYHLSLRQALTVLQERYDMIFMDPPYNEPQIEQTVAAVVDWMGPSSLLAVEHSSRTPLALSYGSRQLVKNRTHGDTTISIYR